MVPRPKGFACMSYVSTEVDKTRESARAAYEKLVLRLQDELDRLIKMYAWTREAMERSMFEGMGYKQLDVDEKSVKKLKELTIGMNSLVETKIKWDKAQKQLAATMTPAEEMAAVMTYIEALDGEARHSLRSRLAEKGIWPWKS